MNIFKNKKQYLLRRPVVTTHVFMQQTLLVVSASSFEYSVKYNNNTLRTDVHIQYFALIFSVSLKNEPELK